MNKDRALQTILFGLILFLVTPLVWASMMENFSHIKSIKQKVTLYVPWTLAGCALDGDFGSLGIEFANYERGQIAWVRGDRSTTVFEWRNSPDLAVRLLGCGVSEQKIGHVENALVLTDLALSIRPGIPRAHLVWGLALAAQGNYQQSIEQCRLETLVSESPWKSAAFVCIGDGNWELRNAPSALTAYQQALEIDPNASAAYAGVGKAGYEVHHNAQVAIALFERARDLNPVSAWYPLLEGDVYMDIGRFEQACASFDLAVQIQPDFWLGYYRSGECSLRIGDLSVAVQSLEKAADLVPDNVDVLLLLGQFYKKAGQLDKAMMMFQRAVLLAPDNLDIRLEIEQLR